MFETTHWKGAPETRPTWSLAGGENDDADDDEGGTCCRPENKKKTDETDDGRQGPRGVLEKVLSKTTRDWSNQPWDVWSGPVQPKAFLSRLGAHSFPTAHNRVLVCAACTLNLIGQSRVMLSLR